VAALIGKQVMPDMFFVTASLRENFSMAAALPFFLSPL
jgi:hypothetical protein